MPNCSSCRRPHTDNNATRAKNGSCLRPNHSNQLYEQVSFVACGVKEIPKERRKSPSMRLRHITTALCVFALGSILPADAAVVCRLSDGVDSYRIVEWNNTTNAGKLSMNPYSRDVIEQGDAARDYLLTGIFVIDPVTARTMGAYYISQAGTSATVHFEAAGQKTIRTLPQRDLVVGSNGTQTFLPGTYKAGRYHILGLSMGGGDGASLAGTDDRTETYTEVGGTGLTDCTPVAINGSLHHFDEHDFIGTQISAPGAGVRQKVKLAYDNADQYLVGAVHHEAALYSYFDISSPTGGGRIPNAVAPISSFDGRYTFLADQAGIPARISINFLTYTLQP